MSSTIYTQINDYTVILLLQTVLLHQLVPKHQSSKISICLSMIASHQLACWPCPYQDALTLGVWDI
jgi:hypothetical protein